MTHRLPRSDGAVLTGGQGVDVATADRQVVARRFAECGAPRDVHGFSVCRLGSEICVERWTRMMLRFRSAAVVDWLAVVIAGGYGASRVSSLLANTFTVPGSGSYRAQTILKRQFGQSDNRQFIVVF